MKFNILIRRIHMFLALFLIPWILIYALGVFGGNHRAFFEKGGPPYVKFEKEKELNYHAAFSEEADPKLIAEQILADLGIEGTYVVNYNKQSGIYIITRRDPFSPRRITYTPSSNRLVVEKQLVSAVGFLQGLHHRNSFRQENVMDDTWAFSVDLAVLGMIFWALSGLWMWWQFKVTRRWGILALLAGFGLFGFFLVTI